MKTFLMRGVAALGVAVMLSGASAATGGSAQEQASPPPSMAGCSDDVRQNATREQFEFQSGSRTIRGLIYKPRTSNGAAIVLLHGFRGLQPDAPVFDPHAIQLATRGYTVLVPNYFDARPYRDNRSGQDMRAWSTVALDAVKFAGTQPGIDPQRVGVWGFSLGGFLAVDSAVSDDGTAAAAVGVGAGNTIWSENSRGRREIPVLMIHGRADNVVSPSSMRSMADSLRRRGATVDIQLLDSSEHVLEGPIWCEVFQSSRAFFDSKLLPAAPAA